MSNNPPDSRRRPFELTSIRGSYGAITIAVPGSPTAGPVGEHRVPTQQHAHGVGRTNVQLGLELRHALHDPQNMAKLRRLASSFAPGILRDYEDREVRDLVSAQLQSGRLQALTLQQWRPSGLRYDEPLVADDPHIGSPDPVQRDTWLGVVLRTPAGERIPNERYIVLQSDGKERHGTLGERGDARLDGIPLGPTRVCFPYIDRGDWRLAASGSGPDDLNDDQLGDLILRVVGRGAKQILDVFRVEDVAGLFQVDRTPVADGSEADDHVELQFSGFDPATLLTLVVESDGTPVTLFNQLATSEIAQLGDDDNDESPPDFSVEDTDDQETLMDRRLRSLLLSDCTFLRRVLADSEILAVGVNAPGAVRRVQQALMVLDVEGAALGNPLDWVDGKYGPLTKAAVKLYQQANGLADDGIVGPLTLASLDRTIAEDTPDPLPSPN